MSPDRDAQIPDLTPQNNAVVPSRAWVEFGPLRDGSMIGFGDLAHSLRLPFLKTVAAEMREKPYGEYGPISNFMEAGDFYVGQRVAYSDEGLLTAGYICCFEGQADALAPIILNEQNGTPFKIDMGQIEAAEIEDWNSPWAKLGDRCIRDARKYMEQLDDRGPARDPATNSLLIALARELEMAHAIMDHVEIDGFGVEKRSRQILEIESRLGGIMVELGVRQIST